ncbi:MAG: gamma-glutamylcyclotransferase [Lentisphaerales bacterium]|nr:gamma-glutamylcyclotransferase [Lentisphaerales bacterium]
MNSDFLFVYGTLKRGKNSPLKHLMNLKTTYLEDVQISGKLYLVSYYPGLKLDSANTVYGELYKITDSSIIERLDEYEGCSQNSPAPHEYRRVAIPVCTSFGTVDAWTYEYIQAVNEKDYIESGKF